MVHTLTRTNPERAMLNAEIVATEGGVPEWAMVLRTGAWMGHPSAPEVVTAAHLQSALATFEQHYAAHGADLVIDYHHGSVLTTRTGAKAPAAGWIRKMELRNNGTELWGQVLWTAEAAGAIGRREYRYLSPVLRFGWPDRVTGEPVPLQLHSVALTNTPFLTELEGLNSNADAVDGAGVNASQDGGRSMTLIEMLAQTLGQTPEEVAASLGLEAGAEDKGVAAAILAAVARVTELETAAAAAADAPEVPADVANALGLEAPDLKAVRTEVLKLQAGADLAPFCNALGLDAKAGAQDVLNAIGELQVSHRKDEAETLVDEAIEAGRVPPGNRDFWLNAAQADLDSAREVLNGLPVLTAPSALAGRKAGVRAAGALAEGELTDEQKAFCKKLGISEETFKLGLTG